MSAGARLARVGAGSLLALLVAFAPARAGEIRQRLSIKFILDAAGHMPVGDYADSIRFKRAVDSTNVFLARLGRGYRYQLLPFATVSGASQFFNMSAGESYTLQDAATADTVKYHWASNAINCYVVQSSIVAGGYSTIPSSPADAGYSIFIWVASQDSNYRDIGLPHELGHYNDLYHTFETGGPCSGDCVSDTRQDPDPFQCTASFGCTLGGTNECCCATKVTTLAAVAYAEGWTPAELYAIRWNCMSYYGANDCKDDGTPFLFTNMVLTDGQLDRWTDATRFYHPTEVTGLTVFVDPAGGVFQTGSSALPYSTVLAGVNAAHAGTDIVMVRGGTYAENLTITKPVTLRASRGVAHIGQ